MPGQQPCRESIEKYGGDPLAAPLSVDRDVPDSPRPFVGSIAVERGDAVAVDSIESAIAAAEATRADVAYVVGGATVYEQFLPRADRLVLTEIEGSYEGDAHFPAFDEAVWTETAREERSDLAFVTYDRDETA